jgi:hypothetical protein
MAAQPMNVHDAHVVAAKTDAMLDSGSGCWLG